MRAWKFAVLLLVATAVVLSAASVAFAAPKLVVTGCDNPDGTGVRIEKGSWYMYNHYYWLWWWDPIPGQSPGHQWGDQTFPLQAGDPRRGTNIVGSYTVTPTGSGDYVVTYVLNDSVVVNGRTYQPVVVDEHLAASDDPITSSKPHKVDNQDFGVAFPGDGEFNVFVYLEIELK